MRKAAALEFEIEGTHIVASTGQAFVIARQLAPSQWELGVSPLLGGLAIHPVAEAPWTLDASGNPRRDLFAFCLKEPADLASLSNGQVVELQPRG